VIETCLPIPLNPMIRLVCLNRMLYLPALDSFELRAADEASGRYPLQSHPRPVAAAALSMRVAAH